MTHVLNLSLYLPCDLMCLILSRDFICQVFLYCHVTICHVAFCVTHSILSCDYLSRDLCVGPRVYTIVTDKNDIVAHVN